VSLVSVVHRLKEIYEIANLRSSSSKKRRLKATIKSTPTFISNNLIKGHNKNTKNIIKIIKKN
jgi:hypothetical protein